MMSNGDFVPDSWIVVIGAAIVLLLLFGLGGTCSTEPEVNTELARTTRTAVDAAEAARRDSDAAYLWPGRYRMLAIGVGLAAPMVAAVVLVWICLRQRPSDLDLVACLDEQRRAMEARDVRRLPGTESGSYLGLPVASRRQTKLLATDDTGRNRRQPEQ